MENQQPAPSHPTAVGNPASSRGVAAAGQHSSRLRRWIMSALLLGSLVANLVMYVQYQSYFAGSQGPEERFHSGDRSSADKLAILRVTGTIMPPFTRRVLREIEQVRNDAQIKGVLLVVNSPGGFVTDSHQIYHRLKELSANKPVYVSMGSMAASGGYYVAMGAGDQARIFAEPTTWTGSIGVIIPHYEVAELGEKLGIRAAPLKTGELKDALSPFRSLTEREKAVWEDIMNQSFETFLEVIDVNRADLDRDEVRALATGQIYTARDAKENGLIDEIGFEEDALAALKQRTGLTRARVVTFEHPSSLLDTLLGSVRAAEPSSQWEALAEASVPRAMYLCGWGALLPVRNE